MTTTTRHKATFSFLALVFTLVIGIAFAARAQEAETVEPPAEDETAIAIKEVESDFEYQIEGRPDPFLPFITESATNTPENQDEIVEDDRVLTGMQLFEPGQLTLVGLILAGDTKLAMVQDFTGKGYVIEEGTKIGSRRQG